MPKPSTKQEAPKKQVVELSKYQVLHPVLKGSTLHPRGSVVALNGRDGAQLHQQGHVIPVVEPVPVSALPVEVPVDLQGFTEAELVEYALQTHDLVLSPTLTKADLLREIGFKAGESA